jgi:hypothetical protein
MKRTRVTRVNGVLVHIMIKSIEGWIQIAEDMTQVEEKEPKFTIIIRRFLFRSHFAP